MSRILLLLAPQGRRLTLATLERISSILADMAQISIASVAIPTLLDKGSFTLIVWGMMGAILFWSTSISVAQEIK